MTSYYIPPCSASATPCRVARKNTRRRTREEEEEQSAHTHTRARLQKQKPKMHISTFELILRTHCILIIYAFLITYLFCTSSSNLAPVYPVSKYEADARFATEVLPHIQNSTVGYRKLEGVQRMLPLGNGSVTSDLTYFWETISTSTVCVCFLFLFADFTFQFIFLCLLRVWFLFISFFLFWKCFSF